MADQSPAGGTAAGRTEQQSQTQRSNTATPNNSIQTDNADSANNRRRRPNRRRKQPQQPRSTENSGRAPENGTKAAAADAVTANDAAAGAGKPGRNRKSRGRKGKNTNNKNASGPKPIGDPASSSDDTPRQRSQSNNNNNGNNGNNNNRGRKGRKRYPWRKHIPQGTVDPITLENLVSLPYPPFAIVASAPYDPVPEWPVPERSPHDVKHNTSTTENNKQPSKSKEELEAINRQRLMEQWGSRIPGTSAAPAAASSLTPLSSSAPNLPSTAIKTADNNPDRQPDKNTDANNVTKRAYNLYDGRALAYYLVSQLQFIDPLNRRDLNRDEIRNLDAYLRRHGFSDAAKVTEAYDAKGITLSTAGAAAATAQGRATILQQTAQTLLQSLFGGSSVTSRTSSTPVSPHNELQAQYAALQAQEEQERRLQQQQQQRQQQHRRDDEGSEGIFASEDGGLVIIDDDVNPGLRGAISVDLRSHTTLDANAPPFQASNRMLGYSADHITNRYGGGSSVISSASFPALQSIAATGPGSTANATTGNNSVRQHTALSADRRGTSAASTSAPSLSSSAQTKPRKPSKTLSRITGAVRRTDPQEQQRQWAAREAARRKAMMTNLTFGAEPNMNRLQQQQTPSLTVPMSTPVQHSEAMLQRNRNLAEALGVQPSTMRQQAQAFNSGWARTIGADGRIALDEFGNELNAAIYPQGLIMSARERMPLLLKLEKKWKVFLADDSAASLPLNPMDRGARVFTHHYSDFWKIRTESFDPEPRRYIHCVKMTDTCTPSPLLSEVARNWTPGVTPTQESVMAAKKLKEQTLGHTSEQTAGQSTDSESKPSLTPGVDLVALAAARMNVSHPPSATHEAVGGRFDVIDGLRQERPKLELAQRTLPLALPPQQQPEAAQDIDSYDIELIRKEREDRQLKKTLKARNAAARRNKVLMGAFASDSEDDDDSTDAAAFKRGKATSNSNKVDDSVDSGDDDSWGQPDIAVYVSDDEETV